MKRLLFLSFILLQIHSVQSQNIVEKKVLYSVPGVDNKLTTYLGVSAMGGTRFEDNYPNVVEAVDLKENGFIIRDKLKMLYFDNMLTKVSENDLGSFYDKSKDIIKFYNVPDGVWIIQESINPKAFKLGFLNKKGSFMVKSIGFQEKYDGAFTQFDVSSQKFQVVAYLTIKGKDISHSYTFNSLDLSFVKTVDPEENGKVEAEDPTPYIYRSYTSPSDRSYQLKMVVMEGKVKVIVKELLESGNKEVRNFEVSVPTKQLTEKIVKNLREEPNLYINEENNDVYIFFNMRDAAFYGFLTIHSPGTGLASARIIDEDNIAANKLERKYFTLFSMNQIICPTDGVIFMGHHYPLLNFHSRAYNVSSSTINPNDSFNAKESGASTQNMNNTVQLSIGDKGEIVKAEYFHFKKPPLKHKDLILIPNERTLLFKNSNYKPQEMDLIYDSDARLHPDENVFSIIRRKDYSFIINFKEKDSAVEVWKVKF